MKRSRAVALVLAGALAVTSATVTYGGQPISHPIHHSSSSKPWVAWFIMGCASMIVLAAMIANSRSNRPLTSQEAMSCGWLYYLQGR